DVKARDAEYLDGRGGRRRAVEFAPDGDGVALRRDRHSVGEVQQRVRAAVAVVFVVRRRAVAAEVDQGGGRGVGAGRRARYGIAREPVLHVGRAEHEDARRAAVDDVALDAV